MRTLDHAAIGCHRGSAGDGRLRCGPRNAIRKHKPNSLLQTDLPSGDASLLQSLSQPLVRALVFLPDPYVWMFAFWPILDLFSRASFFESGTHVKRVSLRGQDQREHPFAAPPANSGEVPQ